MNLKKIPAGENFPEDVYVIIEIPANSSPIKYEINKENSVLFVDRFIPVTMFYPCNYGYINNTISSDGDPMDVLVPTPYPLQYGCVIKCRPIGILRMTDESGEDIKLISVPHSRISNEYDFINDISDLSLSLKLQIVHFFKHYKDLEEGKWVKVEGWGNAKQARKEIIKSFNRTNIKKY